MRIKTAIAFFICFAIATLFFGLIFAWNINVHPKQSGLNFSHEATIGNTHIFVDYARTQKEQTTGLSGQKSLGLTQGLLFIFDHLDYYGIWMKDMNFPIDVIWFDSAKRAVYIKENFSPSSYPEVINSPSEASFILEVTAGFVKNNQINAGDLLSY